MKKKCTRQGSNPLNPDQVSNLFLFLLFDPPQLWHHSPSLLMTMQVINHRKSLNVIEFFICYSRQSAKKCIMKSYLWKQLVIIYPVSLELGRQQVAMKIFFFHSSSLYKRQILNLLFSQTECPWHAEFWQGCL